MVKKDTFIIGCEYKQYPINNSIDNNIVESRMSDLYHLLASAATEYCRTLVFRFDLRLPLSYQAKTINYARLMERFTRKLRSKFNSKKQPRGRLRYAWCRERESSKHEHWHFVIICDGKLSRTTGMNQLVEDAWAYALETTTEHTAGLIDKPRPKDRKYKARLNTSTRNPDTEQIAKALYHASYLTKLRGITAPKKGTWGTSKDIDYTSQLPPLEPESRENIKAEYPMTLDQEEVVREVARHIRALRGLQTTRGG